MKNFKVLIVGAGNIGALLDEPSREEVLTHAHACSIIPAFQEFAFFDVDPSNLSKAASLWGKKTYTDFEEALRDFQPDIISLCTPPQFRRSYVEKLPDHLKFVFFEKPLGTELSEVEMMASLIQKKKIPAAVNYLRLFSEDINQLRNSLTENKYGKLIKGTFTYSKGLRNNGSHVLSLLQFLLGDIASWRILGTSVDYSSTDPNADIALEFKKGGIIYMLALDEKKFSNIECHLFFEKARIVLKQFGHQLQISETRTDPIYHNYTDIDESADFKKTDLDKTLLLAYENILHFLNEGKALSSTLENALKIEKLLNEMKKEIQ